MATETTDQPTTIHQDVARAFGRAFRSAPYWADRAYARDGQVVAIRVPNKPELIEILKRAGFRWNRDERRWETRDDSGIRAEILAALTAMRRHDAGIEITGGWGPEQY